MSSRSSDRRAEPLRGLTVFVARPVGQARPVASRLRALGADAISLPTASLRPTDEPHAAIAALRAIGSGAAGANRVSAGTRVTAASGAIGIFVSPAAVRYAFALEPGLANAFVPGSRDQSAMPRAIAVGPSTQRALARHHVHALVPGRFDSEGVLALPALESVRGQRFVLVGAPGGRDAIRHGLVERGATVEFAAVYRRAFPRWTRVHRDFVEHAPAKSALIVSSADALEMLAKLGGPAFVTALARRPVVVPGERVERAARTLGFENIIRAGSALPAALVDALVDAAANASIR